MSASRTRPPSESRPSAAHDRQLRLLRSTAAGDRAAFEELYREVHPRVVRFLYRMTRNAELADELFNEVMFVVWRKAGDFRGGSKPSTWILGIAHRKALKALSRRRRSRQRTVLGETELETMRDPRERPDRRELRDWLDRALETLPAPQRVVLELAYHLGYSCREIAEIVDCPVNTVKTRMFHARRKLRELLPVLAAAARPHSPEEEAP